MVREKRSLIGIIQSRQRNWLSHIIRGDSHLSKNYSRVKNGKEKDKRKNENDVIGLNDEEDYSKLKE